MTRIMSSFRLWLVSAALLVAAEPGYAYYNPTTGRWLSRDPIGEKGGKSLYAFVANAPISTFDAFGKISACSNPCEQFRIQEEARDRYVPSGAIVCCGGVKFICTWGADQVENSRAKDIIGMCIREHEEVHLPNVECDSCSIGPKEPKWTTPEGKPRCEEELRAHGVSKSCLERSIGECGGDQKCIDAVNAKIESEQRAIEFYTAKCKAFDRRQ